MQVDDRAIRRGVSWSSSLPLSRRLLAFRWMRPGKWSCMTQPVNSSIRPGASSKLALLLAESEGFIDRDVLFAAAFLHDLGAFEPFAVAGAEHSQVAAETVASILEPTGFPMEKIGSVQTALAHMYYAAVPEDATARVLHDADLNFLGALGVTRISTDDQRNWAADLPTAVATLEKFQPAVTAHSAN